MGKHHGKIPGLESKQSQAPASKGQTEPWVSALDQDLETIYRWQVWLGKPLFSVSHLLPKSHSDRNTIVTLEKLQPPSFWIGLLRLIGGTVSFVALSVTFGVLLPFTIIYGVGEIFGHHPAYLWWARAQSALLFLGLLIGISKRMTARGETQSREGRQFFGIIALTMLPIAMYTAASPGAFQFEVMGNPDQDVGLLAWLGFYSYMITDLLMLGLPQTILGEVAALRPSSTPALIYTLMIRLLITTGVITMVITYIYDRLRSRFDITATLPELIIWSRIQSVPLQDVYVKPIAVEQSMHTVGNPVGLVALSSQKHAALSSPNAKNSYPINTNELKIRRFLRWFGINTIAALISVCVVSLVVLLIGLVVTNLTWRVVLGLFALWLLLAGLVTFTRMMQQSRKSKTDHQPSENHTNSTSSADGKRRRLND